MIVRLKFIFLLLTISLVGYAQQRDKIYFKEYGVKEGLPEEVAITLLEDEQGFIWIGTQNGLVKFDGYQMQVFGVNHQNSAPNSLKIRNLIGGLLKARDGKIWIGGVSSRTGLSSYNPKNNTFQNFLYHPDSTTLPFPSISPITEDYDGNIWFLNGSNESDSMAICRYDQKADKITCYNKSQLDFGIRSAIDNKLNFFVAEDSSVYFLDPTQKLCQFNKDSNDFVPIKISGLPDSLIAITKSKSYIVGYGPKNLHFIDLAKKEVILSIDYQPYQNTFLNLTETFSIEDQEKNLWVTSGSNIYKIDSNLNLAKQYELGKDQLTDVKNPILLNLPIHQDSSGVWFHIAAELNKMVRFGFDHSIEIFDDQFNAKSNPTVLSGFPFAKMLNDFSNTRWLGTRPNLYKEQKKKINFLNEVEVQSGQKILLDTIRFMFEDSQRNVWIALTGGILKRESQTKLFQYYEVGKDNKSGLRTNIIDIIEDHEGGLWFRAGYSSQRENDGIYKYNTSKDKFDSYFRNLGVRRIAAHHEQKQIWIAAENQIFSIDTKGNVLKKIEPELTKGFAPFFITNDSKGNTWFGDVGDNDHALIKYNANDSVQLIKRIPGDENSISSNEIHFIVEDSLDNIWVGTDGGLNKFTNDHFIRVNPESCAGYTIDKNKNLWVGTYSGMGLLSISPESLDQKSYGMQQGLAHNDLALSFYDNEMTQDDEGRIYFSNYRGLSVINTNDRTIHNFDETDGYQYSGRRPLHLKLNSGQIWISSEEGVNVIDPKQLFEDKNTIPPKVWITSMTIMDSVYASPDGQIFENAIDFTDKIKLEYWQKDLGFDFVALHYLRPEDNQYSWKLEGYDKEWSTPSLTRSAAYTNLSPGTYTFRVKGSNADGVWNEEGDYIKIIITPPIWYSTGAYLCYAVLFGLFGIMIYRLQKERTIRKERERIKDDQLAQAKEIEKAYDDLKHTQTQLIHAEKMASLGELTAGIAHEIQNPLNFVNNFSDLNKELLEELKDAVAQNDQEEVAAIIKDLSENETKINHHGKRAEEIVKSMLQHSRTGSGEKELTDINALADEYLRLSYHGLRAKDKSFNADFKAELDPDLPKVKVIPQDLGRVVLNLINNAFQACNEQRKSANADRSDSTYQPLVTVSTKFMVEQIEITVADNGSGIPENIRKKIFQPFFTTKAAGEGTGLGLSMSYDIVTKGHKGTIEVQSEEGRGTKFIIALPYSDNL